MRTAIYKFVHDTITSHRPTNQLKTRIVRVTENKMVRVKFCQGGPANSPRHLQYPPISISISAPANLDTRQRSSKYKGKYRRHMIDIRLLHHGRHRLGHITLLEFILAVFFPYGLEIEIRAADDGFHKCESAGMR